MQTSSCSTYTFTPRERNKDSSPTNVRFWPMTVIRLILRKFEVGTSANDPKQSFKNSDEMPCIATISKDAYWAYSDTTYWLINLKLIVLQ
jgi:hypothetical protein